MPNKEIPEWVKQHRAKNEEEDESEYYKFPEGETEIEIDTSKPPVELEKFDKTRYQYQAKVNGEIKTIEVGKQLDRQFILALMKGLNPMVVIRVGTDKTSTKYSVKGLKD